MGTYLEVGAYLGHYGVLHTIHNILIYRICENFCHFRHLLLLVKFLLREFFVMC